MTREDERASASRARTERLAVAFVAAWTLAALAARPLGPWPTMGAAALVLGTLCLVAGGPRLRHALRPRRVPLLAGSLLGIVGVVVTHLAYPPAAALVPYVLDSTTLLYAAFRVPPLAVASLALVPVVVGEELVWRGVVQRAAVDRVGPVAGIAVAASLYAAATLPFGSPLLALVALASGLAWGVVRGATGSLAAPIVAHLVWNAGIFVWLPLQPS